MRVSIGSDHAGYNLKKKIINFLTEKGYEITDEGTDSPDKSVDYPDFAKKVSFDVVNKKADRGIIICASGVGASVAANKVKGIRAGLCHDTYSAHQGVEHDDMNVLCMGSKIIGEELAKEIVISFLNARFLNEERYIRRLKKVIGLEEGK